MTASSDIRKKIPLEAHLLYHKEVDIYGNKDVHMKAKYKIIYV